MHCLVFLFFAHTLQFFSAEESAFVLLWCFVFLFLGFFSPRCILKIRLAFVFLLLDNDLYRAHRQPRGYRVHMHSLVGSRDDLSEFLSPEEEELFSLWDANRAVLRDKLILVASCRKKPL